MKFTVDKQKTSVSFDVEFESKDFEPARLKALARLARDIKIPGFRNGKAPANVVEQHVNPNELANQTLNIMVREAIPKLYDGEKIQPISVPEVEITKFIPGESAEVTIKSDIMPEVKLADYTKLKAKYNEPKVEAKDVDDVVSRIADNFAEVKAVKRAAKTTDEVIIDFTGKLDGVAFDGGAAKDYTLRLGSGQFVPGFEEGIVGHEAGDKFELKIKFPKDYQSKSLAGKNTVFEVLLKQVSEVTKPKIDDDLAKKTGAFKTLKDLKADIKKNLEAQAKQRADEAYRDDLLNELVEGSKTIAPEALVKEQAQQIKEEMIRNIQAHGATVEDYLKRNKQKEEDWDREVREAAERRVISHLVVAKLSEELKIKVTDEEVEQQVAELQAVYKKDEHALAELQTQEAVMATRNRIRVMKTMDKLAEINRKK